MTSIAERTVLFADLRGSTGLYESLGNSQATRVVTDSVSSLCSVVQACGGRVIKTLGDGLMASFAEPGAAVNAASQLQLALDATNSGPVSDQANPDRPALKLQVAMARGEVVEMAGDCFGDAVNVSARLLDHAGDNEILATADVLAGLTEPVRQCFRSLDHIQLRGRGEAVHVYLLAPARSHDFVATTFERVERACEPEGIRLSWLDQRCTYEPPSLPLTLGRSPEATHCIDDTRVSRLHARIDWHGGTFQLSDLSYNGSFVRFDNDPAIVTLRRGQCTLHGSGAIGLGAPPTDPQAPCVRFEVLRLTQVATGEPGEQQPGLPPA